MNLLQNVPLKKYSNLKIGGNASHFCEFKSKDDLIQILSYWREINPEMDKIFILGSGTNILFSDEGFDGLVIRNCIDFIKREGNIITVGGGSLVETLLNFCTRSSLSGLEWAGGLPGTVGGAIRGNAGAFLGDSSENVKEVESINISSLKTILRNKKECKFGYRQSIFKKGEKSRRPGGPLARREVIISAKFKLKKGNQEEIKRKTQEKIDYRIDRHPLDLPNIGSTFKNVPLNLVSEKVEKEFQASIKLDPFPVIPTAKLLIGAGLKGKVVGGVMISPKHPNFIVNFNNAKAKDVLALISLAKEKVKKKYNIDLEEEIMVV